jgi:hypothetical protein
MADVVKVLPPSLLEASSKVAEHLETAAKPATAAAPVTAAASPVDVAAHGAAAAIQTKMTAMSTELAPKGPALQGKAAGAAASLEAQDAANAARMPSVPSPPSPPSPSIPKISALDTTWKREPPPPPPPKPRPGLPQPPGGWSNDPALEDAQRIAYGHAWNKHQSEFPGMTQDQLAELIRGMLTGDPRTDPDLHVGQTPTGTTAIYKDGVLVLYDPANTGDLGTVFKPDHGYEDFLRIIAGGSPIISAPPNLPNVFDHPPVSPLPPSVLDHPPVSPVPPTVLDHPPLPPWLADPSPPGFQISPTQSPPIFGWDVPDPAPPVSVGGGSGGGSSGGGPSLGDIGHALEKAGEWTLGAVVVVGGLLGILASGGRTLPTAPAS